MVDREQNHAVEWGHQLLGQAAYSGAGDYLGVIEAVGTSRHGRLRRLGVRRGRSRRLHFFSAEGALMQRGRVQLPAAQRLYFLGGPSR